MSTELNGSKYCYVSLTIQLNISHLFALGLNVNQFYLTHIYITLTRCYHSGLECIWKQWQWKSTPHSPKLKYYWSLTIRLFSVILKTLVTGGVLTPLQRCILWALYCNPWRNLDCFTDTSIDAAQKLGAEWKPPRTQKTAEEYWQDIVLWWDHSPFHPGSQ